MKVELSSVLPVYVDGNLRLLPLYFDLIPVMFNIFW